MHYFKTLETNKNISWCTFFICHFSDLHDCGSPQQTRCLCHSLGMSSEENLKSTWTCSTGLSSWWRRWHLHERVLQEAGSCCCSVPMALFSQGRQEPWVLFQTHWIPGQAWLHDAALAKAKQLGEVYMRTSLSSRLLKPPNTYITLRENRRERMLVSVRREGIPEVKWEDFCPAILLSQDLLCTVRAREA